MRTLAIAIFGLIVTYVIDSGKVEANPRRVRSEAPRQGMIAGSWSSGIKQIFGTAFEAYDLENKYSVHSPTAPISKVWFTGAQGVLTEIFWPSIDTPQTKDSQFLVTDGSSFLFEERRDAVSKVEWLERGIPAYRIVNSDKARKFEIERVVFADPDRDAVIQKVRITRHVPGLKFFLIHNPNVSNTPMGNSARIAALEQGNAALLAWQGNHAQAVMMSIPSKKASAGFEGASDGFQDLRGDLKMDQAYETATSGNVALTSWLDLPETVGVTELDIVIAFGYSVQEAVEAGKQALQHEKNGSLQKYVSQWTNYQQSLYDLSSAASDDGLLFRASTAVLKSMEDKTSEGAFVASPCIPWGEHIQDRNSEVIKRGSRAHLVGGYHLVWPRDLYQMATTFMALKDFRSAIASLNFLKRVQYGPGDGKWEFGFRQRSRDGSFPQNLWINGESYWSGLQMDQTALPVLLAYRLWKADAIAWQVYWDLVRRASDLIADFGPWSAQERWEESFGASPSTIAAQIAALMVAAEFAEQAHDLKRAEKYRATADSWSVKPGDNVEAWTFTTSGRYGDGRYYERVEGASNWEQGWDPNDDVEYAIANNGGKWREKDILDGGFLELVRMGLRPAMHWAVLETMPKYDQTIRVDLPGIGPGFRRYVRDHYNYDDLNGKQTEGMLWPLLTGERGHYELQRAVESGRAFEVETAAQPYIYTVEKMSTPTRMIPEQVWDFGARYGKPTGSATPLGWAHGEYIKLLRSQIDGAVFDRIVSVEKRNNELLKAVRGEN